MTTLLARIEPLVPLNEGLKKHLRHFSLPFDLCSFVTPVLDLNEVRDEPLESAWIDTALSKHKKRSRSRNHNKSKKHNDKQTRKKK
jgi:hypothetical protein